MIDIKETDEKKIKESGKMERTGKKIVEVRTLNPVDGKNNFYRLREKEKGILKVTKIIKGGKGYRTKNSNPLADDVPRTVRKRLKKEGWELV